MVKYENFPTPVPMSDTINAKALSVNTPENDTIPAEARIVVITPSAACYVKIGATGNNATVPGDTTDGSASELIPVNGSIVRSLQGARTRGYIAASSAALTVESTDGITVGDTLVVAGAGAAGADLTQTVSAVNHTTKVVTLGGNASTTVAGATVTETINQVSVISASACIVTLAYYK